MEQRSDQIIGVASGWGAKIRECEEGPEALRKRGALERLRIQGVPLVDWQMLYPSVSYQQKQIPLAESLGLVVEVQKKVAEAVTGTLNRHLFPIVIGGDHSIAVGTWNGVASCVKGRLGLIWIDAHMDAHTSETTPSGAWHGMPLAALLGYGEVQMSQLTRTTPILQSEDVCLIGVRSFEEGEALLLKRLNVRIFYIEEVKQRGLEAVLQEAIEHVSRQTVGYGVSFDIDAIDPNEAPGVGSPESNGISKEQMLAALPLLSKDPRLKAFELVEFNPQRDRNAKTFHLCCDLLLAALIGAKQ